MTRRLMWIFLAAFMLLTAYSVIVLRLNLPAPFYIFVTPATTLFGFGFAFLHASLRWNWRAASTLFVISIVISLAFESIGVATGLVYGPYHYTDKLGPRFLGLVPYLIPVAWFMMMYPSLVIAERIVPACAGWKRGLAVAALGGVAMTAWDVVMDPMMVRGGHWVWEVDGAFFGIPLQNYWGWWLTTFCVFFVNWLAAPPGGRQAKMGDDRLAVLSYAVTGLGSIFASLDPQVIGQLGGSALAGFFAMLPWAAMGWIKAGEE